MGKLDGKVAVVTGGATGIGFAAAQVFVEEGAFVFIMGRRQKELEAAAKSLGSHARAVQGDVAKSADLDRLYQSVKESGRRIDVVFANAGVGEFARLETITEQQFSRLFDINVKGTLFTVQKALPLLNDGASIILTGSVASAKGRPGLWAYGGTKAAIRNFARGWTAELKDRRIRANVVSPGPVDTPILASLPQDTVDRLVAGVPMGRLGRPEEIAKVVLFLASDDSSFVTGVELFADGGAAQI